MRLLATSISTLALAAGACTDDASPPITEPEPKLELIMTATIPALTEVEYCQFVTVPETWVTKDQIEFTGGSHHVLVYQTPYTSIPTKKDDGTPVDASRVFDCSDGATNNWSVTKLVGGSQNAAGESMLSFPEGVGVKLGGVLLINVHYRNGADAPLTTDVKIKFTTTTADAISQEGDILFLYNPFISVPGNSTARARQSCPVYRDITIANIQSHMHSRGIGYEARIDNGTPFYVNSRWEGVPVKHYEGFTVKAGSRIDYFCDYRNGAVTPIYQGPRTTDEMCMVVGSYYPADPRISNCLDEAGQLPGGDWIGSGTATCKQTMSCIQTAAGLRGMTDCILAATPTVAHATSELVRCFYGSQLAGKNPATECGPQIQTCAAQ